jgi:manganese oxidase
MILLRLVGGPFGRFAAVALWLEVCLGVGLAAASPAEAAGRLRSYYIAAEEATWNFAPAGQDLMMGMPFDDEQKEYVERGPNRIGASYKMALYIEYTDASFTKRKPRPASQAYLGILGPIIRAEVGDTIHVVFKNLASRPYSIHPHGVFYTKAAEGAMTNDGTSGADQADDAVAPGQTFTYEWKVPERAGPGPSDPSSVVWPYHSHVDSIRDSNSGLVGAIIVTRAGQARTDGTPKDVDKEFVTLFDIFDENLSWYLDDNIAGLADHAKIDRKDDEFVESNLKHSINGYVFGNMPMPEMRVGEHVRWYLLALGTETDLHTPHWHGNTAVAYGHRVDVVSLLPATTVVADMTPDDPGIWMFHCHVSDHIAGGMMGRYQVLAK